MFPSITNLNGRRGTIVAFALIALLAGIAYANSLQDYFADDDFFIILRNDLILRLDKLPALLLSDYWGGFENPSEMTRFAKSGLYRPFVLLTYALNHAIGGFNPAGYHLVNILLHILVTWLLYLLALQMGFTAESGIIGAALFAVHPIHTEAVTGVVGRAELLMALGTLGSLLWAIQGRLWLSLAAFAVGLFSKEQAAMLPAILVMYDLFHAKNPAKPKTWRDRLSLVESAIGRYMGYVIVLLAYLVLRLVALGRTPLPPVEFLENPLVDTHGYLRLLNVLKVAGRYLWLCIWPATLSPDYSYNAIHLAGSLADPGVLFALLAWGAWLVLALWLFKQDRRIILCLELTVLTFLPVSNLFIPIGAIMGERLVYLPSAGFFLFVALGWEYFVPASGQNQKGTRKRRREEAAGDSPSFQAARVRALILSTLILGALTARTFFRNRDWINEEVLFSRAAEAVPDNAKIRYFLGNIARDKGEMKEAVESYSTALRLYPDYTRYPYFDFVYGTALLGRGRVAGAVEALERAVAKNPKGSTLQYNLGQAYAREKRYKEAEAAFRIALDLKPGSADAHNSLSRLLIELGRDKEALAEAEAAVMDNPNLLWAYCNRGWALERLGRLSEAAADYEQALKLNPGLEDVQQRLRRIQEQAGKQGGGKKE